jgi:LEA14-like dessication related protein
MAALCASISRLLARCSGTLEKLSASEPMNRRTWCQSASALCAGAVLAGCANLRLREPVQVNVVGIEPLPGEGMEMRMAVKLRVQNPNDQALDFDGIAIMLDVRGSTFATGVSSERGSVPRFGETVITVPVSVSALAAVRQLIGLATSDRLRVDYALRGRLAAAGSSDVRFEAKGELDLPAGALAR